jgi:hypothetical protein
LIKSINTFIQYNNVLYRVPNPGIPAQGATFLQMLHRKGMILEGAWKLK